MRPAFIIVCTLLLAGCGILRPGIPDADTGIPTPRQKEPCDVWVTKYPEREAVCISREHMRRDLCKATPGCGTP